MRRLLDLFVPGRFESPADVVLRWFSYVFTLTRSRKVAHDGR